MGEKPRDADVIFLNKADGSVIPLRVRVADDNGEYRTYKIERYREVGVVYEQLPPTHSMGLYSFECIVHDFGFERKIHLFYRAGDRRWELTRA